MQLNLLENKLRYSTSIMVLTINIKDYKRANIPLLYGSPEHVWPTSPGVGRPVRWDDRGLEVRGPKVLLPGTSPKLKCSKGHHSPHFFTGKSTKYFVSASVSASMWWSPGNVPYLPCHPIGISHIQHVCLSWKLETETICLSCTVAYKISKNTFNNQKSLISRIILFSNIL